MFDTKQRIVCNEHRTSEEKKLKNDGYRIIETFVTWEDTRCQVSKCCNKARWYIRAIINHKHAKKTAELITEFKKDQGIK